MFFYIKIFILLFCLGFGPASCNMSGQAAVQALQAQHGDQQGAHASLRSREPIQVRVFLFVLTSSVSFHSLLLSFQIPFSPCSLSMDHALQAQHEDRSSCFDSEQRTYSSKRFLFFIHFSVFFKSYFFFLIKHRDKILCIASEQRIFSSKSYFFF